MTGSCSRPREAARAAPAGYAAVAVGAGVWFARLDCLDGLPAADLERLLVGPLSAGGPGRGRVGVVPIRVAGRVAVGKRFRHGGLLGGILGDLYLGAGRLRKVIDCADRLRGAGVRTPAVLAVGWRPVAGPLQVHALITETIPKAVNLQEALASLPGGPRRRSLLRAAGELVRAMHGARFHHPDLNLANLVVEDIAEAPRAHVVDLDGGRFATRMTARSRRSNLARLLRSWEKWLAPRVPLGARDALAFLGAYCAGQRDDMRRLMRALAGYRRRLWPRRLAWRWFG